MRCRALFLYNGVRMSTRLRIPTSFGPFYRHKPNAASTMEHGYLYDAFMEVPFHHKRRMVRVWLPEDYFLSNKPHPVLYMADGQNLVDKSLTKYGDWHLDRVVHQLLEEGFVSPILVGIDSPSEPTRANELNPPFPIAWFFRARRRGPLNPRGDLFVNFIVDTLKPMVDELFHTIPDREHTAIGGSSMGGIMAFYAYLAHPETFGYSHAFSIPFFFYTRHQLRDILDTLGASPERDGRLFSYVGGAGFEKSFVSNNRWMEKELRARGFGEEQFVYVENPEGEHQEEWWYAYSFDGFRYWLGAFQE